MAQLSGVRDVLNLVIVLVSLLLFSSGCAITNRPIPEEKRVLLAEKTSAPEIYSSGPLTVNYEYQRSGETFTISGSIGFRQSVDSLDVRIFFLGGDGLILGKSLVYSSGFRTLAARDSTRTFRRKIDIPQGTVNFSFEETSKARTSMR